MRLWGASGALQEAHDLRPAPVVINLTNYAERLSRLRHALGEKRLENEWQKGSEMAQNQAIDYALAEGNTSTRLLTPRQKEVAELVAQDLTNLQISEQLVISERTVHTHIQNIFKKLGASSRKEVAERLKQSNP